MCIYGESNKSDPVTSAPTVIVIMHYFDPGKRATGPYTSLVSFIRELGSQFQIVVIGLGTRRANHGTCRIFERMAVSEILRPGPFLWFRLFFHITKRKTDVVWLSSVFDTRFSLPLILMAKLRFVRAPILWSPRGELSHGALSIKSRRKRIYLVLLRLLTPSGVTFHATVKEEADEILSHFPNHSVVTASDIPNRAGASYGYAASVRSNGSVRCVFVSRISPKKNIEFILKVLSESELNISLDIYGPISDESYWQKLCSQILSLPDRVNVRYRGALQNEEVINIIGSYDLFVLPTKGENFGYAIVEALSAGVPVLISDRTPWQGLEAAKAGWAVSLDTPDRFIEVLRSVSTWNKDEWETWREGARKYISQYSTENAVDETRRMLADFVLGQLPTKGK